jgi:hypothetical protein
MQAAVCPSCQRKVVLPENNTSRIVKTMCPKCGELLPVPPSGSEHDQDATAAKIMSSGRTTGLTAEELREQLAGVTASSKNLGLVLVAVGLVGLLTLALSCIPYLPHAGLALSGIGLLVSVAALARGLLRRERELLYLVGGGVVCALAVGLLITRIALASGKDSSRGDENIPTIFEQERRELR